jgi:hypothetical protein
MNGGHHGDVNGMFRDYTYEANHHLIATTYRQTDFLSGITSEMLALIARYPEGMPCIEQ